MNTIHIKASTCDLKCIHQITSFYHVWFR